MKTFEVKFSYEDRTGTTAESSATVDASNLPGAVAKATREFVKSLDRKQRFDMNKSGLEIKAKPVEAGATSTEPEKEEHGETEAAAG